jgi:hypothetical protein
MKTDTRKRIQAYITKNQPISVHQLHTHFAISKEMVHRHLKQLITADKIYKEGTPPKVQYWARGGVQLQITTKDTATVFTLINNGKVVTQTEKIFRPDFLEQFGKTYLDTITALTVATIEEEYISKQSTLKPNHLINTFSEHFVNQQPLLWQQFQQYVQKHFSPKQMTEGEERFFTVWLNLYQYTTKQGRLDASVKLSSLAPLYKECTATIELDKLYYTGIDKIDAHKTIAYETMESIKEFQYREDITEYYASIFNDRFSDFLKEHSIDTILIIPNNVTRQISFNDYISEQLSIQYPHLPQIQIITNSFPGRKAQKKVTGICNRIDNATKLFDIDTTSITGKEKRILVIDDVFGSGATMNTVIQKLKKYLPNSVCIGFALLGSYRKGFDVITGI